mmetsp:Transcript_11920/g.14410  ORF Transcript_11920/g.14410 Transcript_11920/m.14410 type:complete len:233 (-) Transcript_11920:9-707(-)
MFFKLLYISLLVSPVYPYRRGDAISTLVRTQHNGWRTPWTEVSRSEMPQFREDSVLRLQPPIHPETALEPSEPFKISLSYSDSIFVVPWVATLHPAEDGIQSSLNYLKVSLFFSGTDILQVKWKGKYKNKKEGDTLFNRTKSPEVMIQYEWIEVVEHDVEAGLIIMFSISLLAAFGALFTLCSRETITTTSKLTYPSNGATIGGGGGMTKAEKLSRSKKEYQKRAFGKSMYD